MADASWGAAITAQEVRVGDLAGSTLSIEIRSVSGPNASYALYIVVPWAFVPAEAAARIVFAGFDATRNDVVQPDDGTRPSAPLLCRSPYSLQTTCRRSFPSRHGHTP